ncbi:hypothetical protein GGI42DRAFT_337568, partial [Trichoderma sp. SZMC 28013]
IVNVAKASSRRLKGKARTEAKKRGTSQSLQPQKTHTYTLAIKDFVPLAAFIANRADSVRDTLKPCTRLPPPTSAATEGPGEGLDGVELVFNALAVSEASPSLLDALGGDEAVYEAEPQTSLENAIVAYTMMMNDLQDNISHIRWIWENYKKGLFTLSGAAVATDTAIDLARNVTEEVTPLFKDHNGFPGMIHMYLSEEDNFNYDLYEIADEVYMNVFRMLHSFAGTLVQSDVPIYEDGTFGSYDPTSNRDLKTGRQKFTEDKILLLEFFTELITVARHILDYPAKDVFLCGMVELSKTGAVPFYLIFAAQVFLDIHHILRDQAALSSEQVLRQVTRMNSELEKHLNSHTNLKIGGWPASNDTIIRELRKNMRWIDGDPVYKAKVKFLQQAGRPISSCTKRHHILRLSPVLSGLILFHFQVRFRNAGISVTDAWGSTIYTAHLYNALRNEKLLKRRWNGMDVAQILLREESFYVGRWPRNKEGYIQEFCLRLGMDEALFKKPIQDQRRSNSFGSGVEARKIKDRILVSSKFESRYTRETERLDWTPEQIDGICSFSEYQQVGSEGPLRGPLHAPRTTSPSPNPAQTVRRKDWPLRFYRIRREIQTRRQADQQVRRAKDTRALRKVPHGSPVSPRCTGEGDAIWNNPRPIPPRQWRVQGLSETSGGYKPLAAPPLRIQTRKIDWQSPFSFVTLKRSER